MRRYELVVSDLNGGVIERRRFFFRITAERAKDRANAHALEIVAGMRRLVSATPADQLYYARVDRIGGRA